MNSKLLSILFGLSLTIASILTIQAFNDDINLGSDRESRSLCEQNKIDFNRPDANCNGR